MDLDRVDERDRRIEGLSEKLGSLIRPEYREEVLMRMREFAWKVLDGVEDRVVAERGHDAKPIEEDYNQAIAVCKLTDIFSEKELEKFLLKE